MSDRFVVEACMFAECVYPAARFALIEWPMERSVYVGEPGSMRHISRTFRVPVCAAHEVEAGTLAAALRDSVGSHGR